MYERVERGMGLGGERFGSIDGGERGHSSYHESEYWEWGKAGIISMAEAVRCMFFLQRKSIISY